MVKRAIFYDRCNDASRLAAEYAIPGGVGAVTHTVEYRGNRFTYTNGVAGLYCDQYNVTFEMREFEISAEVEITNGAIWHLGMKKADANYLLSYWGGGNVTFFKNGVIILGGGAMAMVAGTVYNIRMRYSGNFVKIKHWARGTAEPDWEFVGYVNKPELGAIRAGGLGFRSQTTQVWWSNLRMYPVPRTGYP